MGLDMYLYRANKKDLKDFEQLTEHEKKIAEKPYHKVAYWRKANQIRQWFVTNCGYPEKGNCIDFKLKKSDLEKLVEDCKTIRKIYKEAEDLFGEDEDQISEYIKKNAKKILPTQSGFFFGSTEYDYSYLMDIDNTIEQCEKVLSETNWKEETVVYYECW